MVKILSRIYNKNIFYNLISKGIHPVLARIYANRNIIDIKNIKYSLKSLLLPSFLLNADKAAITLANAIILKKKIVIFADYDCDGATSCAVGIRGLKMMGAFNINYIAPDRFKNGYGLTPKIVKFILDTENPSIIITVDNGISSIDGIAFAISKGIDVIITDHHIPGDFLPQKCIIINPNQPLCNFPSKNLSGVGVIFYVLLSLRSELYKRGIFNLKNKPNLGQLLDLVALGTIADSVKLDFNNRILVFNGLKRMRNGLANCGISSLFIVSKKKISLASTYDLGFCIAPRINASGRLTNISLSIECLITNNKNKAFKIAQKLDELNIHRRNIEKSMNNTVKKKIKNINLKNINTISIYNNSWHEGLIGIISSRLKDKFYKPTFIFTKSYNGLIKGSGRSIKGFNLRNVLNIIFKKFPFIIKSFGGHSMAAGLVIYKNYFSKFQSEFEKIGKLLINNSQKDKIIKTDGPLDFNYYSIKLTDLINEHVWGQGFNAPLFCDIFEIIYQKIFNTKHSKIILKNNKGNYEAIFFNYTKKISKYAIIVFKLINFVFLNLKKVNILIEYVKFL